jgi:hypothetical protein
MTRFFHWTMCALAAATIGLSAWGCAASGLSIYVHQLYPKIALYAVVLAGAAYFRWRRIDSFVTSLLLVFWMGLLCDLHIYPMFLAARRALPPHDAWLASADGLLGLEVPAILAWIEEHPALRAFFDRAYDSLIPLMGLAILTTTALGRLRAAQEYVLSCIFAVAITFPLFACFQAVGPWSYYGYEPSVTQAEYVRVFTALKESDSFAIDLDYANGLITFPSFHAILALTAGLAFWSFRRLRWVGVAWASIIVAATMTTGWHYVIDVLAGVVVVIASRMAARAVTNAEARWAARKHVLCVQTVPLAA